MSKPIKFHAERFAEAYIQTLPHASKPEDFKSDDDYIEYMEKRRAAYFDYYLDNIEYAENRRLRSADAESE